MAGFTKQENTRQIDKSWTVVAQASYNPSSSSMRRTDLSWKALTGLLAEGGTCTVGEYMAAQRETNPENIGDALPCFRYWAGDGKVDCMSPEDAAAAALAAEEAAAEAAEAEAKK